MIDLDAIHAMVQFPTILMIYAVGLLMLQRARRAWVGERTVPSVAILALLSAYLITFALGRTWWAGVWFLSAIDLHDAARSMRSNLLTPILLNATSILIGAAMITVVFSRYTGHLAAPIVIGCVGACVLFGASLAGLL